MESEYECQYCKKTFNGKYTLNQHQKTAKYCLVLQGSVNTTFTCEYCNKNLCTNDRLYTHYHSCKHKQKQEIEKRFEIENTYMKQCLQEKNDYIAKLEQDYQLKIKEKNDYITKLEAKLEKIETTVTTITKTPLTTNNTTNNITVTHTNNNVLNLSKEHVKQVLTDHLDYNVVYAGQAGLAKFVVDKMLKGPDGKLTYKCVDPSRQMFEFVDETGETVRDMRAEKLIQSLLDGDAIKIGLNEAAKGWNTEDRQLNNDRTETFGPKVTEYAELNRNNTVFRTKVSSLTT